MIKPIFKQGLVVAFCLYTMISSFYVVTLAQQGITENTGATGLSIRAVTAPEMLGLKEGDRRAFFRFDIQFIDDATGKPADIKLYKKIDDLKSRISIRDASNRFGKIYNPFYIFPVEESSGENYSNRDILIVFDTSGSMKATDMRPNRYEAAKVAASELIRTLRPGDQVAIAPFDSRDVRNRIESVRFAPPSSVRVSDISTPGGYTALYSAVDIGLDVLNNRRIEDPSRRPVLILLTDGKNDLGARNPDTSLLIEKDFPTLINKIAATNIQIYTIGFGVSGKDFDEKKLIAMTWPVNRNSYFSAGNIESLRSALGNIKDLAGKNLKFTFFPQLNDYQQLKSLEFDIEYLSPDGKQIRGTIPWDCGASSGCVPKSFLSQYETAAAITTVPMEKQQSEWKTFLWLFMKLVGFSAVIAGLWYLVPRLVWPNPKFRI